MSPFYQSANALDWGVQYVHVDGSDSANGLLPDRPKATVEAAYADLDAAGGVIVLGPGRHDVGDGLALNRTKPAVIEGVARWRRYYTTSDFTTYPGTDPVLYSSTGAERLVTFDLPNVLTNAYGFAFTQFVFEISPTTEIAVDLFGVNQARIEDCMFWSKNTTAIAVRAFHGQGTLSNDCSWNRVVNCQASRCQFLDVTGPNINQWVITDNVIFGHNEVPLGMKLRGTHRCVVRDNNVELFATGIQLGEDGHVTFGNELTGNGGEGVSTFYEIARASANFITGPGRSSPTIAHRFCHFGVNSAQNVVVAPGRLASGGAGNPYLADRIVDDNGTNTVITGLQVVH